MNTQEIESAVEIARQIQQDLFQGNAHEDRKLEALQTLLSVAQLFLEAGKGMPAKVKCYNVKPPIPCNDAIQKCAACYRNEAIDLCTAWRAKKVEGIENMEWDGNINNFKKEIISLLKI